MLPTSYFDVVNKNESLKCKERETFCLQEISRCLMSGEALGLEVVLLPRLRVLEVNQSSLPAVLEQRDSLTGLTCLLLKCNIKKNVVLEPQLFNLISSLHSLTAIKLSSHCSDQLCALLSLACPSLRIFHAEADKDMVIIFSFSFCALSEIFSIYSYGWI